MLGAGVGRACLTQAARVFKMVMGVNSENRVIRQAAPLADGAAWPHAAWRRDTLRVSAA